MKIGEHVSEKLDVEPTKFFVRRDECIRSTPVRACETIVAEPVAPAIIDRGLAAPGLLAQVAIQKYTDHLPLYRQEAIFARHGIELSRTHLGRMDRRHRSCACSRWSMRCAVSLLAADVLHADETPVAQLDPGAGKTKRAYLFAYRSAEGPPIILFDYCASRAGKHAANFLGDWKGALMVDDYGGYKALFADGVTELGCWAHARRKFFDVHKASGSPLAKEALERIGALYAIEAKLRDLDAADAAPRAPTLPRAQARRTQTTGWTACSPWCWATPVWPVPSTTRSGAGARSRASSTMVATRSTTTPSKTPSDRSPSAARTGCSPAPKPPAGVPLPS